MGKLRVGGEGVDVDGAASTTVGGQGPVQVGKSGGKVIGQNIWRMGGVSSLDEGSMLLTRTKL